MLSTDAVAVSTDSPTLVTVVLMVFNTSLEFEITLSSPSIEAEIVSSVLIDVS